MKSILVILFIVSLVAPVALATEPEKQRVAEVSNDSIVEVRRKHVRLYDQEGNVVKKVARRDVVVGTPILQSEANFKYLIEHDGKRYWVTSSDVKVHTSAKIICNRSKRTRAVDDTHTTVTGVNTHCTEEKPGKQ